MVNYRFIVPEEQKKLVNYVGRDRGQTPLRMQRVNVNEILRLHSDGEKIY